MIRFSGSIEIARSPRDVFDFLSDPGNMPLWQSGVVRSTVVSAGPITLGTRFDEIVKVGPWHLRTECAITEFDPPRALGFSAESAPISYRGEFRFEPHEGGTRIVASGRGVMRGLWRLLEPVLAADARRGLGVELERIKSVVEGSRQGDPQHGPRT